MTMIAVIGGTGVYDPDMLEDVQEEAISTATVKSSLHGQLQGRPVAFMPGTAVTIRFRRIGSIIAPISRPCTGWD